MKYYATLILFIFFAGFQMIKAQDNKTTIKIEGYVEVEDEENFGNVKITIYENGAVKETHLTEEDGRFKFTLDLNSNYIIEASKNKKSTKKIEFNTNVPADKKWKLSAGFEFFLFTVCPEMDLSLLNQPVARIKYNPQSTYFEEDKAYSSEMTSKIKDLNDRLEKCRYQKVQDVIDKADESFKNNDYATATKLYKDVEKLDPDNKYAPKQISEIEKLKKKQDSEEKRLQDVLTKADLAYSNKKNDDARDLYKQALLIKPTNTHAQERINEIEKLAQKLAADTDSKKAETERYNNLIAQAEQAEKQNNTDEAIKRYQEALLVNPNEPLPKQRIAAIEQKQAKANQDNQTKKQKQEEFDKLFAEGEKNFAENKFDLATDAYNRAYAITPDSRIKTRLYDMDTKRNEQAKQFKQMIIDNLDNAKRAFKEMDFEKARQSYSKVLELDANNKEATNGIMLCDNKLGEKKAKEMKDLNLKRDYQNSIMQGDNALKQKQYALALTSYKNASQLFPNETYPATKIKEISLLLETQEKAEANNKSRKEQYDKFILKADKAFYDNNLSESETAYRSANELLPQESYPNEQLTKITNLRKQQELDAAYNKAITEGDDAYTKNNLVLARNSYKLALEKKANDSYATQQLTKIDGLEADARRNMADAKLKKTQYDAFILDGDNAFKQKQYTLALSTFKKALQLLPNEKYPSTKIAEIEQIFNDQQEANAKLKYQYDKFIAKADKELSNNKLPDAETAYRAALELLPQETYPNEQLTKIANLRKQQEIDMAYNKAITDGNDALNLNNLVLARTSYKLALEKKANDSYATAQLQKIDGLEAEERRKLAESKSKKDQYDGILAEGNKALTNKNYSLAINSFQSALNMFPTEPYPKQRLAELDKLKKKEEADLLAKKEKYNGLMNEGSKAFDAKNYDFALNAYQAALNLFPTESLPQQKIADINKIKQQQEADIRAKRENFNKNMTEADNAFTAKNYAVATQGYQSALSLFPDEQRPKQRLAEIEQLKKQQDIEARYRDIVANGDAQIKSLNYLEAKKSFQTALELKPSDPYSTRRMAEINKAIADQELKLANEKAKKEKDELEAKERQQKYNALIAEADKLFAAKDLTAATTQYNNALALNPGQTYPIAKLSEIERLISASKLDNDYKEAITKADNTLKSNNLIEAKSQYMLASQLKPNEAYPKNKIEEITKQLEKQQANKLEKDRVKNQYNSCIARADKFYDAAKYDDARMEYEKARDMMPDETYPRQKLSKIKEMKDLLAQNSKQEVKPQKEEKKALDNLKFASDKERDEYLTKLREKYPVGITKEVYKDDRKTITRYIIIRGNEVNDYREVKYSWGGVEYFKTDKPANSMYFNQQVGTRSGEKLYE